MKSDCTYKYMTSLFGSESLCIDTTIYIIIEYNFKLQSNLYIKPLKASFGSRYPPPLVPCNDLSIPSEMTPLSITSYCVGQFCWLVPWEPSPIPRTYLSALKGTGENQKGSARKLKTFFHSNFGLYIVFFYWIPQKNTIWSMPT